MSKTFGAAVQRFEEVLRVQDETPAEPGRLRAALDRLDGLLRAADNPVLAGMRPGIGEDEVRRRLATFGLDAPDDLITWFGWQNGYEAPAVQPWRGALLSVVIAGLDEMCDYYTNAFLAYEVELLPAGSERWFPVVPFGGNYRIVMDCGHDPRTAGTVAGFGQSSFDPRGYHARTLAEPVEWWCEFIELGLWINDSDGLRTGITFEEGKHLPPRIYWSSMI